MLLVSATKLKISESPRLYFPKHSLLMNCLKRLRIRQQRKIGTSTTVLRQPERTGCFHLSSSIRVRRFGNF